MPKWLERNLLCFTTFTNRGIHISWHLIVSIYFTSIIDRRMFYSCLKSSKMNGFAVVLFIILVITVGVLTVCFTIPKPSMCLICWGWKNIELELDDICSLFCIDFVYWKSKYLVKRQSFFIRYSRWYLVDYNPSLTAETWSKLMLKWYSDGALDIVNKSGYVW
jgi:hypothetical protein